MVVNKFKYHHKSIKFQDDVNTCDCLKHCFMLLQKLLYLSDQKCWQCTQSHIALH